MLRTFIIAFGLCSSLSAFATSAYRVVNNEAVLHDVKVEAANGGINPSFSAFKVSARIQIGSNACQAQGMTAVLKQKKVGANQHIVGFVKGRVRENLICPFIYQPVFADVTLTVRGEGEFTNSIFVRNAEEFGTLKSFNSFLNVGPSCEEPVFCTREYLPSTCEFQGESFKGSNLCEARAAVKKFACLHQIAFQPEDIQCAIDKPVSLTK